MRTQAETDAIVAEVLDLVDRRATALEAVADRALGLAAVERRAHEAERRAAAALMRAQGWVSECCCRARFARLDREAAEQACRHARELRRRAAAFAADPDAILDLPTDIERLRRFLREEQRRLKGMVAALRHAPGRRSARGQRAVAELLRLIDEDTDLLQQQEGGASP